MKTPLCPSRPSFHGAESEAQMGRDWDKFTPPGWGRWAGLEWSFPHFTFVFLGYWLSVTRSFYLVIKDERLSLSMCVCVCACVCVMSPGFCVHLSLCLLVSSLCHSVPSPLFVAFSLSVPWFFEHVHSFFTFVSHMVCLAPSHSLLLPLGLCLYPFFSRGP